MLKREYMIYKVPLRGVSLRDVLRGVAYERIENDIYSLPILLYHTRMKYLHTTDCIYDRRVQLMTLFCTCFFWDKTYMENSVELLLLLTESLLKTFLMIPPNIVSCLSVH